MNHSLQYVAAVMSWAPSETGKPEEIEILLEKIWGARHRDIVNLTSRYCSKTCALRVDDEVSTSRGRGGAW